MKFQYNSLGIVDGSMVTVIGRSGCGKTTWCMQTAGNIIRPFKSSCIFMDSVDKMVDKACNSDFINKICDLVLSTNGVLNIDLIKTRLFGNKIYIDLEIAANQDLTLKEAHEIAQEVHDNIENNYEDVKHCMVHVNPKEIN